MNPSVIGSRRIRVLLATQAVFMLPLALYSLPLEGLYVFVKLALLVPCIVLITLPAMLFSAIGVRHYEFGEFGAIPQDEVAWLLIFLFWSFVALVWSKRRLRRVGPCPGESSTTLPVE